MQTQMPDPKSVLLTVVELFNNRMLIIKEGEPTQATKAFMRRYERKAITVFFIADKTAPSWPKIERFMAAYAMLKDPALQGHEMGNAVAFYVKKKKSKSGADQFTRYFTNSLMS